MRLQVRATVVVVTMTLAAFLIPAAAQSLFSPVPIASQHYTPVSTTSRLVRKRDRYHWYELDDKQDAALRKALKAYVPNKPILVLSATADSLDLAEDFDAAFRDAGFVSQIDRPMDVVDGLHCTSPTLAALITQATHIPVIVDQPDLSDTALVLNFGRKVVKP